MIPWRDLGRRLGGRERRVISSPAAREGRPGTAVGGSAGSSDREQELVATGELLQELSRRGDQFVRDAGRFIDIATGQADGRPFIAKGIQAVESPLRFLDDYLTGSAQLVQHLQADHASIGQLLQAEVNLQRTMAPLKFMPILFKIESAPLGAEAQIMFSGLTREIEGLHTQVGELYGTKFRELERIRDILDEAMVRLEKQALALRSFVTLEKTRIQDSLRQLERELAANKSREVRLRRLSQAMARAIQQAASGLQCHDGIRQQLEQARAGTIVNPGLGNLQRLLSQADANCLSLAEFEQTTVSAGGMIEVLFDIIQAVGRQVADLTRQTVEIHRLLQPVHGLATGLTNVVEDLSRRIHLIGLNAQVQAAQYNLGAGLEVLSARTSEVSGETNRISKDIGGHLNQMAAGLTGSVKKFDELHYECLAQMLEMGHQGAEVENELHQLRDEAITLNLGFNDQLEQIRGVAHCVRERLKAKL